MSQNTSVVNFLIHDANGQPQMVKVVQNAKTQPLAQIKLKQNPLKVYKVSSSNEGSNNQVPVYQPIKLTELKCASKLVPVDNFPRLQKAPNKTVPHSSVKPIDSNELAELTAVQNLPELVPINNTDTDDTDTKTSEPEEKIVDKSSVPATMSHTSRRRHDIDNAPTAYTTKRRKLADKVGKGLRHFSMKVCEKVKNKGFTSYNEVADELVLEFATGMHGAADSQQYDHKNIRRRVYDALNVLMAMNIISKEKKEIRWLGLPANSVQECTALEKEKEARLEQIQKKNQQLQELILQHISFKSLIERNKEAESKGTKPSPSSAIHLPFIVVNTSDKALIDCSIANDKTEYMFNFNKRFQIHDDIVILKRMGLLFGLDKGQCTEEDLEKVKSMVPKSLENYVEQMGRGVTSTLAEILEEEEVDDEPVEDEAADEEADANESSDSDSSDVDV